MYKPNPMREYQRQAVLTASPEQVIAKLYDLGVSSCRNGDNAKVRAVLIELISALNFEAGGEISQRLLEIYEFLLQESAKNNLDVVAEIMSELRDAWRTSVLERKAA